MRSTLTLALDHLSRSWNAPQLLPALALLASALAAAKTPRRHTLLAHAVCWAAVWGYACVRVGVFAGWEKSKRRRWCWTAGFLYAVGEVCERAARDQEGLWWAKALLPLTVFLILRCVLALPSPNATPFTNTATPGPLQEQWPTSSGRLFAVLTGSAAVVLASPYVAHQAKALGVCSAIFTAAAFILLEGAFKLEDDDGHGYGSLVQANGSIARRPSISYSSTDVHMSTTRDTAAAIAITSFITSFFMETYRSKSLVWRPIYEELGWGITPDEEFNFGFALLAFITGVAADLLTVDMIRRHGSLGLGLVIPGASILLKLISEFSMTNLWFAGLYSACCLLFVEESTSSLPLALPSRRRGRFKHLVSVLGALSFAFVISSTVFRAPGFSRPVGPSPIKTSPPEVAEQPLRMEDTTHHPMAQLIKNAQDEYETVLSGQSKTLQQAVTEYRRRYGMHPPPNFDKWYEFARSKGVVLIDEYDTIYHALLPFWALSPSVIRARVSEALGFDENFLIALSVRGGESVRMERGMEWEQKAILGMIRDFVQYLPDMDLAFNIHDEPRVVVPERQLSTMVHKAKSEAVPAAFATKNPKNAFSARPEDLNDGTRLQEFFSTRFNRFAHQATWTESRLSCPPDTPASSFEESPLDNLTAYALGDLGFIYNRTAFSDICMSPSLRNTYGFFAAPNAFNIAHDLVPIFSQSKLSSFQDILYPSPWYWFQKTKYDEERDVEWDEKADELYWRGSTTGGYSRNGGWRKHHRQLFVREITAHNNAKILVDKKASSENEDGSNTNKKDDNPNWQVSEVPRQDLKHLLNIAFSHIGQCDASDCLAQTEFFAPLAPRADQQDAWRSKLLLDIDGNAFSGRFYAFLRSKSLVFKLALFREWHDEWVRPWVHFVPLGLRGGEWVEAVRWFVGDGEGRARAREMAERGRGFAGGSLRRVDFEVWMFRLLIEYGRVIDDDRENIGYPGP
ncbi:glycosyltransferase family 90 protein [Aulographum hederae CBS 113979]|uniref:Glycosyltransferase family 90 protein n=1 Tax=Aulographum hederae CBS 113979 TaxID=1176131 RepID=A0A6G1GT59_9PEZI|nr:glycosyltransferase family 90 protein [Aulographum hederae CBS 113979]